MITNKNDGEKYMTKLNKEQEEAANFLHGIALTIAVPGSGKTLVLMKRIENLIINHEISPENICGLCFTRNASEEIRKRLEPILGDKSKRVFLNTIHGFCYHLLKREGFVFELLTGKEQIIFTKSIMKKLRIKDLSIGMILREIGLAKNNLISVEEFRDLYADDKMMQKVADVYDHYDQEMARKMLLDFDSLLIETHRLFNRDKLVKKKYQGIFRHLLVDEFQDTNPLQMEIIKILINELDKESSFWCAGDDWQSIYSFTGASVGNILRFKDTFPSSEQFILNLNYRSTPQIINACQNLIRHNEKKINKMLKTGNRDGDEIIVLDASNEEGEALNLASEISELVEGGKYTPKAIAVLFRCNFQSRIIEEVFTQHKIPYHIENGLGFYNRKEVKTLLDYLRLIHNPDSDFGNESLLNVINIPNRYIGRKFIRELEKFSEKNDLHLYPALKSMPIELPYLRKNVKEFLSLIDMLIEQDMEPADAIHMLRNALDYDHFVADEDAPTADDVKIQNLNQLQLAATKFGDIRSFLHYTESFQDESICDNKNGVVLSTIHKAKGLEYPVVFVVGLIEGLLPSKKGDLEEERRICFVACSRAMKLLYLSYTLSYLNQPSKKSPFLGEILGTTRMK